MTTLEAKALLDDLLRQCEAIAKIIETAQRGKKTLHGHGPYAQRYHDAQIALTATEKRLIRLVKAFELEGEDWDRLLRGIETLKKGGS